MPIRHIGNSQSALSGGCGARQSSPVTRKRTLPDRPTTNQPTNDTDMKTAIIIISDPLAGEEALARAVNALAVASEGKRAGDEVEINFIGTGTRWPAELSKITSPGNALYNDVRELVAGASCACAAVFGATGEVQACGIPQKSDNAIGGTPGFLSLRPYLASGWQVLVF
jgi:hypothetical protein